MGGGQVSAQAVAVIGLGGDWLIYHSGPPPHEHALKNAKNIKILYLSFIISFK